MNDDYVYILTCNDLLNEDIKIIALFIDKLSAIDYTFQHINKFKNDNYVIETDIIEGNEIFYMYERQFGWIYNKKLLLKIFQIHKKDNKYEDEERK